jgi:hypothetical protein
MEIAYRRYLTVAHQGLLPLGLQSLLMGIPSVNRLTNVRLRELSTVTRTPLDFAVSLFYAAFHQRLVNRLATSS